MTVQVICCILAHIVSSCVCRDIILARREQENFQLIIITHDEKCAPRLP